MKKQYITPEAQSLLLSCREMMITPGSVEAKTGSTEDADDYIIGGAQSHEKIWDNEGSIWE